MAELDPAFLRVPLAHRGLHDVAAGRLENSPAAFAAALEAGYGIELDIQPSVDGVPMVFHDYDLYRLTGQTGPIRARRADALGRITLTGGKDTIPTLDAVLEQVAGRVPLLIEIKDQEGALGPGADDLPAAVAAALADYDGPVAVMSYNPYAVAEFAARRPEIATGWVTESFGGEQWPRVPAARRAALAALDGFGDSPARFVSCDHQALDRPPIEALGAHGVPVLCWTIRSPAEEAAARRIADNITFEGYLPPIA